MIYAIYVILLAGGFFIGYFVRKSHALGKVSNAEARAELGYQRVGGAWIRGKWNDLESDQFLVHYNTPTAVEHNTMPMGNGTHMTAEERRRLGIGLKGIAR